MGANHSLCWSLLFGLALRQVAAPLYTVESFSPYSNSTLQTNDCKACALLQRLSNFLLIFHIFISNPPGVIAVAPELFPFLLCTTHPSTPNAELRLGCTDVTHVYSRCGYFCSDERWKTWLCMKMDSLKFVQLWWRKGKKKN
jgi:hypothetical protein